MRLATIVLVDLIGICLVSFGAWLAWPPAGFIVSGIICLLFGAVLSRLPSRGSSS